MDAEHTLPIGERVPTNQSDSIGISERMRVGAVEVRVDGDVVRATLDRPGVRNAIDSDMITGLAFAVDVAERASHRVLVIRGAGHSFCAGADLRELERLRSEPDRLDEFMRRLGELLDRIEAGHFVSIAVVEGHAVAGGCEILLACDLSVASATAVIGDGHVRYGLVPAAGGSVRLATALPPARSNLLLLTGRLLPAQQAADWGLVSMVVAPDDLDDAVEDLVATAGQRGTGVVASIKAMTAGARDRDRADALDAERRIFGRHVGSAEAAAGLAAFRARRAVPTD